jgi:hypothetical protein
LAPPPSSSRSAYKLLEAETLTGAVISTAASVITVSLVMGLLG